MMINGFSYNLVIYLFYMKLFLLLSIMVLAFGLSPQPIPTCSKPGITLKDLPITVNQIQSFNANDFLRGYNLNYSLEGAPNWAFLRDKFKLFKKQNISLTGLKNFHMDHIDNHWGNKLVTTSQAANSTIIRWGISDTIDAVPTVTETATVESDPNIDCFDAVWLRAAGIIMVDCIKKTTFAFTNVFLYLNATSQTVIPKQWVNPEWVGFTEVRRRKIYHLVEDGQQYLVRAYFADAVNPIQAHNTYAQILLISDPYCPWTIKVMDRSYLGQDKLSITDFKIYLGDIYILDYHSGVISFDITPSQNIVIRGRYRTDSGYHKLGVYSNNLANQVLLALANDHGIYEVDWTNHIAPVTIAKYSIMQGSRVVSLWVNEQYIAAQIVANVTNGTNQTQQYHSTFIFDRGTRTYTNAYATIAHSTYRAGIDLNIQHNALLSIDQDGISTYFIDEPKIFLYPTSSADLGKEFNFTLKGTSTNQRTGHSLICSFDFRFVVVQLDSMAIWETGLPLPEAYYANFPGELVIPLNRYVIAANLTYGVQQKVKNESLPLPNHWVLQQNSSIVHWDRTPQMFKYTFLRKEQFEFAGDEVFFIYSQDYTNQTHFAECRSAQFSKDVYCHADSHVPHINQKILNLTATAFLPNYGKVYHIAAVLLEGFANEVFLYDVTSKQQFSKPIIFDKGWQGNIQSIEFIGHFLVVVLRHIKTIVFYDMKHCDDHQERVCQQIYRIDSIKMQELGVKYFSPLQVYSSDFHPFVLFIQNVDSVIILDITHQGALLLDVIDSPGSSQAGFWKFKVAITKGHLVIINPPNIIEEFSLEQLYTRKITVQTKNYPLYNYTILDKFDCDFSDSGDMLYITAIDKDLPADKNTVILVYRSAGPAVSAFYDVFHIEGKYDDMLIDVTGVWADYVTVTMGSILMMYRQYGVPVLIFQDSTDDFQFNITYTNDKQGKFHYLFHSQVFIANYPTGIIVNQSKLNQTDYLSNNIKYEKKYTEVIFDDATWFNGSVTNYTLEDCAECGQKLRVVNHLDQKRDFYSQTDMQDYCFTHDGGVIQQFQSIIKMQHNGSIDQVAVFPSVLDGQHCTDIKHSWIYDFTLSACEHLGEIYLYTTTFTSFKPFVNGPFYSGAKYVTSLHIMEDILIIVDVDENPWQMNREGGVIIYAMNHDPFDPEMFDQLQIIETDDLQHAINWPGGPAFIGNADLSFTNDSQIYRISITEVRRGMFFVDFKWSRGRRSIQIIKVEFIDLNKHLIDKAVHMPNGAFFEAIRVTSQYFDQNFKYWQLEVVITTRNFHTFKFDFHIDRTGTVLDVSLSKIFYRYGYYDVANYMKHFDGYFAIIHNLPTSLEPFEQMTRKLLTVYDTRERWVFDSATNSTEPAPVHYMNGTNVAAQWMLGGMRFPRGRVAYDFNFTLSRNRTDPFRDIGLLVVHDRSATIREVLVHDHISIVAEEGIGKNQFAKFKANSDFASVTIPLKVVFNGGDDTDGVSGGAIVGIVIGCILVAVGGGYLVYRWNLKRRQKIGKELQASLIDRDTLNLPDQNQQDDESSSDQEKQQQDQDEDQDQDQGEQQQHQQTKPSSNAPIQNIEPVQNQQKPVEQAPKVQLTEPAQGQEKKQ